jgi:hypothetical protein
MAYFRKGVASFELEEYETALTAFKNGKAQFDKEGKPENSSRPYSRWIRKCETELDDDSEDEIKVESTANGGGGGSGNSTKAAASEEPQPPTPQPKPSLKYQFYQSADWVTVSLMEKKLQEPELQVSIEEFTLSVTVTREGQEVQEKKSQILSDGLAPHPTSSFSCSVVLYVQKPPPPFLSLSRSFKYLVLFFLSSTLKSYM